MSIVLAIDYGEKRIGLAISDEYAKMALPYDTIDNISLESVIEKLQDIIKEESVEEVVVGVPKSLQGEHKDSIDLKKFLLVLKKNVEVPIALIDERMSSKAADRFNTGKDFKKSGVRDKVAASLILESYLVKRKSREPVKKSDNVFDYFSNFTFGDISLPDFKMPDFDLSDLFDIF